MSWARSKKSESEDEGIELTTFKVWGKHLSGGLGEEWVDDDDDYLDSQTSMSGEESRQREQEKTLFSGFPRDFNTYRNSSTVGQRPRGAAEAEGDLRRQDLRPHDRARPRHEAEDGAGGRTRRSRRHRRRLLRPHPPRPRPARLYHRIAVMAPRCATP